jgi:hypothetical protein
VNSKNELVPLFGGAYVWILSYGGFFLVQALPPDPPDDDFWTPPPRGVENKSNRVNSPRKPSPRKPAAKKRPGNASKSNRVNSPRKPSPRKPAAKKRPGNAGRRGRNPFGSNPNKKQKLHGFDLDDTSPPFSVPRAFSGDENNPALQLDGDFRVIWCLHRSDGFYYWDWKKFDAWEIHNWQKLDKNQKISMKIIRKLMTDPEVYGSPYT